MTDTISAYDALPDDWKGRLANKKARYTYMKFKRDAAPTADSKEDEQFMHTGSIHPIVISHPVTGNKNIYANCGHTVEILGVSPRESDEILAFLDEHVSQPQFVYTHYWKLGDAVLWDNLGEPINYLFIDVIVGDIVAYVQLCSTKVRHHKTTALFDVSFEQLLRCLMRWKKSFQDEDLPIFKRFSLAVSC